MSNCFERQTRALSGVALSSALALGAVLAGAAIGAVPAERGAGAGTRDPNSVSVSVRAYDRQQLLNPPKLSDAEYRGRALWLQRCAYCHDGVGQPSYQTMGTWIGAETIQTIGDVAFRAITNLGTERMPGFQYSLKPQQMDELMAFIKTVPASTKPTADQLAGRLPSTQNAGNPAAGARGGGARGGGAPGSSD
jgi:mono/diheme cytochrome c family protein